MDCPAKFAKPLEGEGPVLNAADDLEWIMAGVSPRLAADQRFWICLETETSCIGGVVSGARAANPRAQPAGGGIVGAVRGMEPGSADGTDPRGIAHAWSNSQRPTANSTMPRTNCFAAERW